MSTAARAASAAIPRGGKYTTAKTSQPRKIQTARACARIMKPNSSPAPKREISTVTTRSCFCIAKTVSQTAPENRSSISICGRPESENCHIMSVSRMIEHAISESLLSKRRAPTRYQIPTDKRKKRIEKVAMILSPA